MIKILKYLLISVLTLTAITLVFKFFYNNASTEKQTNNKTNQITTNNYVTVEEKIKKVLPANTFLREYELIPSSHPDSYLIIYIEKAKFDPETSAKEPYTSCPDSTTGQAIEGVYHLALFQNNKLVSDTIIPPSKSPLNKTNKDNTQKLVFKNTKTNIYNHFYGSAPSQDEKYQLKAVKLINLEDLNGDGKELEFKLIGPTIPCGFTQYLIAGYNEIKNQTIIYPIIKNSETFYWQKKFVPNIQGKVEKQLSCGDHGSSIKQYELYEFDTQKQAYVLKEEKKESCL